MKIFYFFIFLLISSSLGAQDFNGQWKGGFNESSYGFSGMMGNSIHYVLELQTTGSSVSGFSYTYFNEGPKKYYTICKLTGIVNRTTKEIEVTETERVKYNTPPDFQNCFQTHKLRYIHDSADIETLRGTWVPAPNQTGNCGYGTTVLSRRIVYRTPLETKPEENNTAKTAPKTTTATKPKTTSTKPKTATGNTNKPLASTSKNSHLKVKPANKPIASTRPPVKAKSHLNTDDTTKNARSQIPDIKNTKSIFPVTKYEPRRKDILKTIPIVQPTFKVDFYDNGEIDGDSITVFYNNKIVLSHKMLTTKAISLTLSLDENVKENVITMYADNLGTIPPNTALMIVTDGDKRYEVRITSDTEKSGSVIFVHGQK